MFFTGHYVSHVKCEDGVWRCYNDMSILSVSIDEEIHSVDGEPAYVYFYVHEMRTEDWKKKKKLGVFFFLFIDRMLIGYSSQTALQLSFNPNFGDFIAFPLGFCCLVMLRLLFQSSRLL
jgi:hypothetical protein